MGVSENVADSDFDNYCQKMKIFFRKLRLDLAFQTELKLPLQYHQEP